jgi:dTDP-4-dehydrorhamnose reductase
MENSPCSYIIRTAWLYGEHGDNFVTTMIRLMNERDRVAVVADQRGSPTWAADVAGAVGALMRAADGGGAPYGIYHYTDEGEASWYDFAREIFKRGRELGRIGNECAVIPCGGAEYPAKARRPAYSVLDTTKIKTALNIEIPAWEASLGEFLKRCAN